MAQATDPGRGPDRQPHGDEAGPRLSAVDRLLDQKLDRWAARPPRAANAAAIGFAGLLMIWLLAGTRDLPERESVFSTIGAFMACCHIAAHLLVVTGLKRLRVRGLAAAARALGAYRARITQRDVAMAWALFALIAVS